MIFRGQWSATLKNRGRSKKTQGWTALKSGGSSLAVGSYLLKEAVPPPLGLVAGSCLIAMVMRIKGRPSTVSFTYCVSLTQMVGFMARDNYGVYTVKP